MPQRSVRRKSPQRPFPCPWRPFPPPRRRIVRQEKRKSLTRPWRPSGSHVSAGSMGRRGIESLSPSELREQVILCHEHFRRCLMALRGEDAEPVSLLGGGVLGDSDDLELFYLCRKFGGRGHGE